MFTLLFWLEIFKFHKPATVNLSEIYTYVPCLTKNKTTTQTQAKTRVNEAETSVMTQLLHSCT